MRRRIGAAALAAVLVLGACGADEKKKPDPRLSAGQAHALALALDQARQAGAARDLNGALMQLRSFREQVVRLRRAGAIDAATARRMRIGAARAEAQAKTELAPPPVVQAPAPTPEPKKDKKPKHYGDWQGNGGGDEGGGD
jgi:hypothetical protein